MSTSGGGKTKKKDDGDMLAEMLHKTSLKDKRIRKQPERLTIAHTPKKAAAPRADTKSGADELLRVARAGIYDKDEAKAMASAKEAEKIQIEKIHKIHAVLDAELTLLEKIRRQIQYRKDHFAKKNAEAAAAAVAGPAAAAAAAAAALALVPRTGSVGSQDSEMKSRSRSRSASEGAQMAAPGVVLALPAAGPAPMAQDGGKKKRRAVR
jgi:hypothetical protein